MNNKRNIIVKLLVILVVILVLILGYSYNPVFAEQTTTVTIESKGGFSIAHGGGGRSFGNPQGSHGGGASFDTETSTEGPASTREADDGSLGGPSSYYADPIGDPTQVPFAPTVISVVQYLCYTAAVIWIILLGIKYMTSSPDAKAEIKKQAFAALIGGLVLFGVGTIIKVVYGVVSKW